MMKKGYGFYANKEINEYLNKCYNKALVYLKRINRNEFRVEDNCNGTYSFFHIDDNENVEMSNIEGAKLMNDSIYIINGDNVYDYINECNKECIVDVLMLLESSVDMYSYNEIINIYMNIFNRKYNHIINKNDYLTDIEYKRYLQSKAKLIYENINLDVDKDYPLLECTDCSSWRVPLSEVVIGKITEIIYDRNE